MKNKKQEKLAKKINDALLTKKPISIISYHMTRETEKKLDLVINLLLNYYQKKGDYKAFLYTCAKELAINGLKANHKRIFFEENNLRISNPDDYQAGIKIYKKHLNEEMASVYGKLAKNKKIFVIITFHHDFDGLRIEVINNSSISKNEEIRVRNILSKVMKYEELMDFYIDHGDETEGAGLGLALVVTLFKKIGINPDLFRIIIKDNFTIARMEIPFTNDFSTIRDIFNNNVDFSFDDSLL